VATEGDSLTVRLLAASLSEVLAIMTNLPVNHPDIQASTARLLHHLADEAASIRSEAEFQSQIDRLDRLTSR
jgi:hypothetical protein